MGDDPKKNVIHLVHPRSIDLLRRVAARNGMTAEEAMKRAVKALVKYDKKQKKKGRKS